eukprot:1189664-Prorocentrum_minimum.AAC.2
MSSRGAPVGGGEDAGCGGHQAQRSRAGGVPQARLAVEGGVRRAHHHADPPARGLLRLEPRGLHPR